MTDVGNLVGIHYISGLVEGDDLLDNLCLAAVATSKEALGTELNKFCIYVDPNVLNGPGNNLLNVVIGDPWLLTDVKVIARGRLDGIEMPKKVRELLSVDHYRSRELVVFENKDGGRVYIFADYTTLLENVIGQIDKELLPEHLREA